MNETIQNILNRRSIREFREEQISDEELNIILECGRYAPSGMNRQSYAFVVIQNEEMMHELVNECMQITERDGSPFYGAPTVILVFGDENSNTYVKDSSCAIENMYIAATALKIGACWINCVEDLFNSKKGEKLREEIEIPNNYKCVGSLALGYIMGNYPEAKPRKENIVKIIK